MEQRRNGRNTRNETERNETKKEWNGTERNGTERNGTERNGTQAGSEEVPRKTKLKLLETNHGGIVKAKTKNLRGTKKQTR